MTAVFRCRYVDGQHACWSGQCPVESPVVFANLPDHGYVPLDIEEPEEDELGVIHPPGWTVQQH